MDAVPLKSLFPPQVTDINTGFLFSPEDYWSAKQ